MVPQNSSNLSHPALKFMRALRASASLACLRGIAVGSDDGRPKKKTIEQAEEMPKA
jgi:hypothetical protein